MVAIVQIWDDEPGHIGPSIGSWCGCLVRPPEFRRGWGDIDAALPTEVR